VKQRPPHETEFGHKVNYAEVDRGFIVDWNIVAQGVLDENDQVLESAARCYKKLFKTDPAIGKWTFSTSGVAKMGMFNIPTFVFGPGEEKMAHAPDESVPIDDLVRCAAFYAYFPWTVDESFGGTRDPSGARRGNQETRQSHPLWFMIFAPSWCLLRGTPRRKIGDVLSDILGHLLDLRRGQGLQPEMFLKANNERFELLGSC